MYNGNMHDDEEKFEHPAQAVLELSRIQSSGEGAELFGSDNTHADFMAIRIKTATHSRRLERDWIHGHKTVVEVRLSFAQWAQFVSSQGIGSGTPCTFVYRADMPGRVPEYHRPFDEKDKIIEEFDGTLNTGVKELTSARRKLEDLIDKPGTVSKAQLKEIAQHLTFAYNDFAPNISYVVKTFGKHVEKTVARARIEAEAFASNIITRLGLNALHEMNTRTSDALEGLVSDTRELPGIKEN